MAESDDWLVRWLKRMAWVLGVVFLGMLSFFVWRAAMLIYRVEQSVAAISTDLEQVMGVAARISSQLEALTERLAALEKKSETALGMDEVEATLDAIQEIRGGRAEGDVPLTPTTQAEIDDLLTAVRRSGLKFSYSGKITSAWSFYLYLKAKYRVFRGEVTTPEDFIAKVASQRLSGDTYFVLHSDESHEELASWLGKELQKYREARPSSATDTGETGTAAQAGSR